MVEGQGFRLDPEALYAFADAGTRLAGTVDQARDGLTAAGGLPAGTFGEVGESSGFVAAYAERTAAIGAAVHGIGQGMDGLSAAVRTYVNAKLQQDADAATDLQRAEEPV